MAKIKKILNVGIVGAGLIGGKRADAIRVLGERGATASRVVAIHDPNLFRAEAFAKKYDVVMFRTWEELVKSPEIDVVIVAVPNAFAAKIAIAALRAGKHVLCEKPLGITPRESRLILAASRHSHRLVKAGFNHRFHPAIARAKELFDRGAIGKLVFIRGRYGHGGRAGMENEWRFNRKISGGGELLDQGVHLIDLMRWFGGDFENAYGVVDTKVWKSKKWKPNVEDNAFAILKNRDVTASLHASVTNWGNIFSLEIFGDKGYLIVEGLGRWYGVETLKFGKRKPLHGDVVLKTWTFPGADKSWEAEWKNFVSAIRGAAKLNGSGEDGLRANEIVEALYQSSRFNKEIKLK